MLISTMMEYVSKLLCQPNTRDPIGFSIVGHIQQPLIDGWTNYNV